MVQLIDQQGKCDLLGLNPSSRTEIEVLAPKEKNGRLLA
jgi:hypothetical protein